MKRSRRKQTGAKGLVGQRILAKNDKNPINRRVVDCNTLASSYSIVECVNIRKATPTRDSLDKENSCDKGGIMHAIK